MSARHDGDRPEPVAPSDGWDRVIRAQGGVLALNDPVDWREPGAAVLASCGFLPDFPPVQIGGRLLGDGACYANAPVDVVLRAPRPGRGLACIVVDLFPRGGERPGSIEPAATRRCDLIFANRTHRAIEAHAREERLQRRIGRLAAELARHDPASAADKAPRPPPLHLFGLAYRPLPDEAGPERQFDFSQRSVAARWAAGQRAMEELIGREGVLAGLAVRAAVSP
jgi:NTE family protein